MLLTYLLRSLYFTSFFIKCLSIIYYINKKIKHLIRKNGILYMRCAARMSRGRHHLGKLYIFSMFFEQFRYALSTNLFNRDDFMTWLFANAITNSVNLTHPETSSKSRTGYDIRFQALVQVLLSHSSSSLEMNCKLIYLPLAPVTKAVLPA